MNKKLFSALSMVLCLTIVFCGSAFAAEGTSTVNNYTEITNLEDLLRLGAEQYAQNPQRTSTYGAEADNSLQVTQLLQEKTLPGGIVEEQYVQSGILLINDESQEIPVSDVARAFAYSSGTVSDTITQDSVALTCKLYFTRRISDVPLIDYRVDKVVTTVTKSGSAVAPVYGTHAYYICKANPDIEKRANFNCLQSVTNQTFTLTSSHSGYYQSTEYPYPNSGTYGESYINLSNGTGFEATARLFQSES